MPTKITKTTIQKIGFSISSCIEVCSLGSLLSYSGSKSAITIKLVNSFNLILMSLTYLRGLEVAELKEEDMPMVLLV